MHQITNTLSLFTIPYHALKRCCDLFFFFFFFFFAFHFSGNKVRAPPPPLFGAELRHWSMCRYIYNWNNVWCDVKQPISGEVNWLFNVTINDISVIDVQVDWRRKLDLRSDSQRHRHFVRFFNVTVQARTRGHPFIRLFREIAPFYSHLLRHAGDTGDIFSTYSPGSLWGINQSHSLTRMTIWREKGRHLTQNDNAL